MQPYKYLTIVALLATQLLTNASAQDKNLLLIDYWRSMSGASTLTNGKVVVTGIDRKIRPKTNGKWYLNPPINLTGPKILTTGNFEVKATLDTSTNPTQKAYLDIYGSIPVPYDEWRIDGRNVRFGIANGVLSVWVNMIKQRFDARISSTQTNISLSKTGNTLSFTVNGRKIGSVRDSVFLSGAIMFGADADKGSQFSINSLTASPSNLIVINNSIDLIKRYPRTQPSLRSAVENLQSPIWVGTAIQANPLLSDATYAKTIANEFNMVTSEMDMKWQAIHPSEGKFAWAEADALVRFAELNDIRFRGHTLVWHEALPTWVWDIYNSGNKERLRAALMNHVTTVVTRYKGRIKEWDVLNEIFSDEYNKQNQFGLRDGGDAENNPSIWYKAFGPQIYIDIIKKVRELDPNCEIWINEYGIEQLGMRYKLNNMADFINYAKSQGAKIDGVAFQAHNYDPVDDPSLAADVLDSFDFITKRAGVKVRISELDVADASKNTTQFSDKFSACINFNNNITFQCSSVGLWGFTDKYGSMSGPKNQGKNGTNYTSPNWGASYSDGLIFDLTIAKKEAYNILLDAIED